MTHVAALLVGALVGLLSVAVHREGAAVLLLAVATSLATAAWLHGSVRRSLAAAYCLGWVALLGAVSVGRPEGDYALAADPAGYVVVGTGLVLLAAGIGSLGSARPPGRP